MTSPSNYFSPASSEPTTPSPDSTTESKGWLTGKNIAVGSVLAVAAGLIAWTDGWLGGGEDKNDAN